MPQINIFLQLFVLGGALWLLLRWLCFLDGCSWDGCSSDGCSLHDFFLNGYFLDGCILLMINLLTLGKLRLMVIFLSLSKSKINLTTKFPHKKLDAWANFWATYPCHRHSTLASQTCEGLPQFWALHQLLSIAYFSWLFRHPVFWFTLLSQHSQLGCLWLPTPHCAAPVWLTGHHAMPAVTRCLPPREAEDFPRGSNHSKHMSLLTYLAWF